jgi:hypothetical protein
MRKKNGSTTSGLARICRNFKVNDPVAPKIIRTKRNKESNNILKIPKIKDSKGDYYIPFCDFSKHTGLLLTNYMSCIKKRCRHYNQAYLKKTNFKDL